MAKRVKLEIRVPERLKSWVDRQVETGRYRDASAFFEQAAKQMRTVSTPLQIDAALNAAIDEGPAKPLQRRELRAMENRIRRKYLTGRPNRKSA
jgi:Arc/MetJ-type ribon-helix-helix transcriptional regulator